MESLEDLIDVEDYRDSIATVDETGKRLWVYPKKPRGFFYNWRLVFSYTLITAFFALPFVKINGHEFIMFNLFERKFILLGTVFVPQDFHLFAIGFITFFVFIILFTVVFGRIWCGWACPQTLFMETVFRRIEYWIEGDYTQQRKLNERPWDRDKILKKTAKFTIFIIFSVLIGHTVMAYLIGVDKTLEVVSRPPSHNIPGFIGLVFFTSLFFFVFVYLREQACIAVCPYGRLQSVLLSKESIVVAYDFIRGEKRGKLKRKQDQLTGEARKLSIEDFERPQGDCIDCGLCVRVCPTGIDIRNGTQMECINCTACIDACDEVMDKIQKPKGLIRYASYNDIADKKPFKINPRIMGYSFVLLLLVGIMAFLLTQREQIEATVLRAPGSIYQVKEDGSVSNIYTVQIANKSFEDLELSIKLKNSKGKVIVAGETVKAAKSGNTKGAVVIELPPNEIKGLKTAITLEFWAGDKLIETVTTNFLSPDPGGSAK